MDRKIALLLAVIFLTGFAIRLFPVKTGTHFWDETVYLQHGEIIAGESPNNFNEFNFRPPLLPLLLGGLFTLVHSTTAAHIFLAFLSATGILLTFRLGQQLFSTEIGILASIAYALSYSHVKLSHDILVDPLLPLLWIGTALALYRGIQNDSTKMMAAAGAFTGLAILAKFTSLALIPISLFLILYHNSRYASLLQTVRKTVKNNAAWTYLGCSVFILLPFLIWSYTSYESFLHTFTKALEFSGSADPFPTYITSIPLLIPLTFLIGLIPYSSDAWNAPKVNYLFPAAFILGLYLPLQLLVANKELRFLFPLLPFLAVATSHGLTKAKQLGKKPYYFIIGLVILGSLIQIGTLTDTQRAVQGRITTTGYPPVHTASMWLKNNTAEDTPVYTNFRWPIIAYYSKRPVVFPPPPESITLLDLLDRPGYIYYSTKSPPEKPPSLYTLQNDPRFTLNKTFNDKAYLFYYRGN